MQRHGNCKIRLMMEESCLIRQTFKPMSYVKHQARSLYFTENVAVKEIHNSTMADILDDVAVTRLDVVGKGSSPCCSSLLVDRVESFTESHRKQSVSCFTDAATSEVGVLSLIHI